MRAPAYAFLCPLIVSAAACAKPTPPELIPERVTITQVTPAGVEMRVAFDAYNANRVDLTASQVKATLTLNHNVPVGDVTSTQALNLPAGQHSKVDVPLSVAWTNVPAVMMLATSAPMIPFELDGTVTMGGSVLHVDLPFHLEGTLTQKQLLDATKRSIPGLFP